jgi:hypothetical protein
MPSNNNFTHIQANAGWISSLTVGVLNASSSNFSNSVITATGSTGPIGPAGPDFTSTLGFIAIFAADVRLNSSNGGNFLSYNGKHDLNTVQSYESFYIPKACSLKAYSYAVKEADPIANPNGFIQIQKGGIEVYSADIGNFPTVGGYIDDNLDILFAKGEKCDVFVKDSGFENAVFVLYFS